MSAAAPPSPPPRPGTADGNSPAPGSAHARTRYDELKADRDFYITEAWKSAQLTIPAIMPDTQDIRDRRTQRVLDKPYSSLGARGVNNLASKLLLTLFPPASPFFRYEINPGVFDDAEPGEEGKLRTELQRGLAKRERTVLAAFEAQALRSKLFQVLKHLLVTGNSLTYSPPEGGMQVFPLNSYVTARDGEGNLIELVYVEVLDRQTAPNHIQALLGPEHTQAFDNAAVGKPSAGTPRTRRPAVEVYTWVRWDGDLVFAHQELANGTVVPDSELATTKDAAPWLALRYTSVDGEEYGRGFCEEYRGDLAAVETISKALQYAAVNASKLIPLVRPGGTVKLQKLKRTQNGEPIAGEEGDVTFLRLDKGADIAFALQMLGGLERALASDFLLNSSFQRPGERVTAEEIRRMAEELEDSLGGTFSMLSQDLQLPLAKRTEFQLLLAGSLEPLPENTVAPTVVTGLAAIGRGQDVQRLREFVGLTAEAASVVPDTPRFIKASELAKRLATGAGVDTDALLKTDQEVAQEEAQERQQAMQAMLLQEGAKGLAPGLGKAAADQSTAAAAAAPQGPTQ